eukprot:scaffold33437_cov68-Attheya_sp.AAC.2
MAASSPTSSLLMRLRRTFSVSKSGSPLGNYISHRFFVNSTAISGRHEFTGNSLLVVNRASTLACSPRNTIAALKDFAYVFCNTSKNLRRNSALFGDDDVQEFLELDCKDGQILALKLLGLITTILIHGSQFSCLRCCDSLSKPSMPFDALM